MKSFLIALLFPVVALAQNNVPPAQYGKMPDGGYPAQTGEPTHKMPPGVERPQFHCPRYYPLPCGQAWEPVYDDKRVYAKSGPFLAFVPVKLGDRIVLMPVFDLPDVEP